MNYINPADLSALNSAVRATESFGSAARGGAAGIERIVAARESAGLSDADIFKAIARGVGSKKSGLYWLCRINGTLTEYLSAWGAVAFIGVASIGLVVAIKQNGSRIWNAMKNFVTNNPLAAAGGMLGAGFLARGMFNDEANDNASREVALTSLQTAISSALPMPLVVLAGSLSAGGSASAPAPVAPANPTTPARPSGVKGGFVELVGEDAYDAYDAYDADGDYPVNDAYDAYDSEDESGNIGNG